MRFVGMTRYLGLDLKRFRQDRGIERLPDGRIAIPGDFCFVSLAPIIAKHLGPGDVYTAREVLEDVEVFLDISSHDFSRHTIEAMERGIHDDQPR